MSDIQVEKQTAIGSRQFIFSPCVLWFTGLSGAGKSTTALGVQKALRERCYATYFLDGDILRLGLNKDLGFTDMDRKENNRRTAEVASLMMDAGLITLVASISPFRATRDELRKRFMPGRFIEIYVDSPLSLCESRDVKGLYRKVREGKLDNFTGVDSPYETPLNPEIHLQTDVWSSDECIAKVLSFLEANQHIRFSYEV
jgi:adenylyl-sulfate kinase